MSMHGLALVATLVADTLPVSGGVSRLDVSELPRARVTFSMATADGRWVARPRTSDFTVTTTSGTATVQRVSHDTVVVRRMIAVLDPTAPRLRARRTVAALRSALDGRTTGTDELTVVAWSDSLPVLLGPGTPAGVFDRVLSGLPDSTTVTAAAVIQKARGLIASLPPGPYSVLVALPRVAVPNRSLGALAEAVGARPGATVIVGGGPLGPARLQALASSKGLDGGPDVSTAALAWAIAHARTSPVALTLDVELPAAPEGSEQEIRIALAPPVDSLARPLSATYLALSPGRFSLAGGGAPAKPFPLVALLVVAGGIVGAGAVVVAIRVYRSSAGHA